MMRRVGQDFAALFGSIGRPGVTTLVYWGCAALAYPLAAKGGYAGAVGAAIVLSLAVFLLAYVLGSGVVAFIADAKRSCLPGRQQLARRANLVAAVLLLPPLVLPVAALAADPAWPAWIPPLLMLAIAFAGMLAPRRPSSGVGLFLLIVLAACWTASGRNSRAGGREWIFALLAPALVLLTATIPLLASVNWHRMIRRASRSQGSAERLSPIPARASSRHAFGERQPPARIVRTCLGGMFGQVSRQLAVGSVLLALLSVAAIGLPRLGVSGSRWTIGIPGLLAAGIVSTAFLAQLSRLTRAQIAELALIPGLGAPAAQLRGLCRAVLTPPLIWLGTVLLLGSADLLLRREPLSNVAMLAACLCVMWLMYALLALQMLASLPPKRQSFISQFMMLYVVVYAAGTYYWAFAAHPQLRLWFWFWNTPVLAGIGIASAIGLSLRRLATAPHPFIA
ncbi:MAG TPA: hypothetical protein VMA54_05375 [Steroidobacteraceae bacterium]|nr:hypothetical protein [Steroidobacteraceae bacterium]